MASEERKMTNILLVEDNPDDIAICQRAFGRFGIYGEAEPN